MQDVEQTAGTYLALGTTKGRCGFWTKIGCLRLGARCPPNKEIVNRVGSGPAQYITIAFLNVVGLNNESKVCHCERKWALVGISGLLVQLWPKRGKLNDLESEPWLAGLWSGACKHMSRCIGGEVCQAARLVE